MQPFIFRHDAPREHLARRFRGVSKMGYVKSLRKDFTNRSRVVSPKLFNRIRAALCLVIARGRASFNFMNPRAKRSEDVKIVSMSRKDFPFFTCKREALPVTLVPVVKLWAMDGSQLAGSRVAKMGLT
jgi:hypothetical protein